MSTSVRDELIWRFAEIEDPEVEAREQQIREVLLQVMLQRFINKGRIIEARVALREVLGCRQLVLSQDDEARIEASCNLATLERWHRQAITASTVADALR